MLHKRYAGSIMLTNAGWRRTIESMQHSSKVKEILSTLIEQCFENRKLSLKKKLPHIYQKFSSRDIVADRDTIHLLQSSKIGSFQIGFDYFTLFVFVPDKMSSKSLVMLMAYISGKDLPKLNPIFGSGKYIPLEIVQHDSLAHT